MSEPTPAPEDPILGKIRTVLRMGTEIAIKTEELMAGQAELMAKIAELQGGQTELLKDARRLIQAGDTSGAITKLDEVIASNTALDAEVEAAAPEPPVEEPAPPAEEPLDLNP